MVTGYQERRLTSTTYRREMRKKAWAEESSRAANFVKKQCKNVF